MKKIAFALTVLLALPSARASGAARPVPVKAKPAKPAVAARGKATAVRKPPAKLAVKPAGKPTAHACAKPSVPAPAPALNEAPKPAADDPDRERLARLQEALDGVVRGKTLGRLRVGMRVEDLSTGRVLYGWRSNVLMDPASNQKVLAATTALLRLGNSFRYRTEVTGGRPDAQGAIAGDIVVRGSGDPSLRARHVESLAADLIAAGVTRINGSVLADPRRIGSDESPVPGRSPLRVGGTAIQVRVRPGERVGSRPVVSVTPASDAFVVVNQAETRGKGRNKVGVELTRAGGRFQVTVSGTVSLARGEVVVSRTPPHPPLHAAILLRHALVAAGVVVQGSAGLVSLEERARLSSTPALAGELFALNQAGADVQPPLTGRAPFASHEVLAVHESDPLPVLLRRVNKDSDNEWAERVLETVGAEVLGGVPSTAKGVRVLRESLAELGLPTSAYLPFNGSGLGHQNRVTAAGMAELLRRLYFDPRLGPELMQSLSVGGVDGTTRNRFRGTSAAHRVRAKTGTLSGVSCLSGFVGDGTDILAFSILVEGHRRRAVPAVRGAQVSAVNAMMRFARGAAATPAADQEGGGTDYESGEELDQPDNTTGEGQ